MKESFKMLLYKKFLFLIALGIIVCGIIIFAVFTLSNKEDFKEPYSLENNLQHCLETTLLENYSGESISKNDILASWFICINQEQENIVTLFDNDIEQTQNTLLTFKDLSEDKYAEITENVLGSLIAKDIRIKAID